MFLPFAVPETEMASRPWEPPPHVEFGVSGPPQFLPRPLHELSCICSLSGTLYRAA